MQQTQQPVQAKPAVVPAKPVVAQKPVAGQVAQPVVKPGQVAQPIKKKPKKWWIWLIVAVLVIGGGIFAYFQFLS